MNYTPIDTVVERIRDTFPTIAVEVEHIATTDEILVKISDETVYESAEYQELVADLKIDFLWRQGMRNVFFTLEEPRTKEGLEADEGWIGVPARASWELPDDLNLWFDQQVLSTVDVRYGFANEMMSATEPEYLSHSWMTLSTYWHDFLSVATGGASEEYHPVVRGVYLSLASEGEEHTSVQDIGDILSEELSWAA